MLKPSNKIYISKSFIPKAGRGIFAAMNIKKGEIIEICPVFVLPKQDYSIVKKTAIRN